MVWKKIILVLPLIFLFTGDTFSQARVWETYTSMKDVRDIEVVAATNEVFCATSGGLFEADMQLGSVKRKFTNVDGLLSVNLLSVKLDNHGKLWIGASDGSISIYDYQTGSWKYIYDIKNSNEIDKSINDFLLYNGFMYVATGYGIQKISTSDYNFVDAPYSQLGVFPANNTKVNRLALYGNMIFAATDAGLAYAQNINSNLNNPQTWQNFTSPPLNQDVTSLTVFDNKIFAGSPTGLIQYDGTNWAIYPNSTLSSGNIRAMTSSQDRIYIATTNTIYFAQSNDLSNISVFQSGNGYTDLNLDINSNPVIGTSDNGAGINTASGYSYFFPNGPNVNSFIDIEFDVNGKLWACGGTVGNSGIYTYANGVWETYTIQTNPEIGTSNDFRKIYAFEDGRVWLLSFGGGATFYQNNTFTNFNPSNSPLPPFQSGSNFCVPTAGVFDLNGNFWTAFWKVQNAATPAVWVRVGDQWQGVPIPAITSDNNGFFQMGVDEYNTKWMITSLNANRLYYYNENGTIGNFNDDIYGFYSAGEFSSDITSLTDMIVDKNGEVWVTTNNGVFIINNPVGVLQGQKPPPRKMGIISGNLIVPFTESCRSIASDELNNKWIGTTSNGVFYLSEDGTTLFEQYNTTNSPLLDNDILTIKVNPEDGRAYFGTGSGLTSVNTDAVEPVTEFEDIICSPNPFLLPSSVDLRIDGLVENASVKIVTLTGNVVAEFESPGGKIATWQNSKNLDIASGIYMVIAYNKDGSKVGAGKFAVVKR
jgi:ligand-binding sensor domain-containing protein